MKLVVALGGNALLRRGEPTTIEAQRYNAQRAAKAIAALAHKHRIVVTHGNGPQVGLLAAQEALAHAGGGAPLDVVGAETEGMVGYLLEQELANALNTRNVVTVLTRTEVRADDPAFAFPTKLVGPVYPRDVAEKLAAQYGWRIGPDGPSWRRVVASPEPQDILELGAITHLRANGFLVICAGGGGIPVSRDAHGRYAGVDGVIDKDLVAALLARQLGADALLLLTDVPAVFDGWGGPTVRRIRAAHPDALAGHEFASGSMGPKVEAARRFALHGEGNAYIGALEDGAEILAYRKGTCISSDVTGVTLE
ncbi:MAG TPA: carbamate kinase [Steroidobacteraceae bacterium]|nr:carbamate kinase [Steroidobacteraceae bacterium]